MTDHMINRAALLPFNHPDYEAPTAADVRALKAASGKTGRQLCDLAGVEDQRSWRRWTQDPGAPGARRIPYAVWRLLLTELGSMELEGDEDE